MNFEFEPAKLEGFGKKLTGYKEGAVPEILDRTASLLDVRWGLEDGEVFLTTREGLWNRRQDTRVYDRRHFDEPRLEAIIRGTVEPEGGSSSCAPVRKSTRGSCGSWASCGRRPCSR
jgi:hypothetical protein